MGMDERLVVKGFFIRYVIEFVFGFIGNGKLLEILKIGRDVGWWVDNVEGLER